MKFFLKAELPQLLVPWSYIVEFDQRFLLLNDYIDKMEKRKDRLTALVIDAALTTCSTHGVEVAALVMAEHDIPFETVLRVLTSHRQRRAPGQLRYVPPADYSAALAAAMGNVR